MEASEQKAGVGEEENPWFVDSLEHFRYYFCPECAATKEPFLSYDKFEFVQHALEKHPQADGAIPVQELEEEEAPANPTPPSQNLHKAEQSVSAQSAASGSNSDLYSAAATAGYKGSSGPPTKKAVGPGPGAIKQESLGAPPKKPLPPPGAVKKKRPLPVSGGGGGPSKKPHQSCPPTASKLPLPPPRFADSSEDGPAIPSHVEFPKGEDGKYTCPWEGCGQVLANTRNVKRHYKTVHMEQLPQTCKVCHQEFRNQAACDTHMKAAHNITNGELKRASFVAMSPDGLHGVYILENGKSLCSQCSVAFANKRNGRRHFAQVHLGVKDYTGVGESSGSAAPQPSDRLGQQQQTFKTEPGAGGSGGYQSSAQSSAFPSSTTPTRPMPKPKAPKSSKPKNPTGGGVAGGPPVTPTKVKSETLPLLVQHDMGASPMKPKPSQGTGLNYPSTSGHSAAPTYPGTSAYPSAPGYPSTSSYPTPAGYPASGGGGVAPHPSAGMVPSFSGAPGPSTNINMNAFHMSLEAALTYKNIPHQN